jgi:D-3-phosphoglycerate dehydrogenase / 2-oxoglutarate reductase
VAEQMSDYLMTGAVSNALNMPSISAEEAPRLKPYVALAEKLGSFAGQLTDSTINGIIIEYAGEVGEMNTRALTSAALAGILQAQLGTINMVSAPVVAKERGIKVDEVKQSKRGAYETYIRITVKSDKYERSVAGTVFTDGKPRIIQIKGIELECNFGPHMLYITNQDKPGFVGAAGTLLGNAGINMGTFHLGRMAQGGDAISIIETDGVVPEAVMEQMRKIPNVLQVKALKF